METSRKARGSAIILVAAVLAALVLIGSAFLLTTVSEKKVALSGRQAVPMEPVAEGVLDMVRTALVNDLHIDANGPYGNVTSWQQYVDYASPDPGYDNHDNHLASIEPALADGAFGPAERWPKLTDLVGLSDPAAIRNQDPAWEYLSDPGGSPVGLIDTNGDGTPDPLRLVDTDGDGIRDAFLFPTGTYDEAGQQFFAAVRVVDMSGLVNVNTALRNNLAWSTDDPIPVSMMSPINMPLRECQAQFAGLQVDPNALRFFSHDAANGTYRFHHYRYLQPDTTNYWNEDVVDFAEDVSRRLPNPDNIVQDRYRPYDWADELSCRWRDYTAPGLVNPRAQLRDCRLARSVIAAAPGTPDFVWQFKDWAHYSRHITTFSASRILTRPPAGTVPPDPDWARPRAKVDLNLPLEDSADREAAFKAYRRAFYHMLPHISVDADRKKMAVQLALNLIDFRDKDDVPTCELVPGTTGPLIMGVEPQPFVVHHWYKVVMQTAPLPNLKAYVAVVLHNPYVHAFTIEASKWGYQVGIGGSVTPLSETGTLGPGQKWVFVNDDEKVNVASGTGVVKVTELSDMEYDQALTIYRQGKRLDDTDKWVPVASVPGGYAYPPGMPGNTRLTIRSYVRDARPGKFTLFAGEYLERPPVDEEPANDSAAAGHPYDYEFKELCEADDPTGNELDNAAELKDLPPMPIYIRGTDGSQTKRLVSVGDLGRLLYVGPTIIAGADVPVDLHLSTLLARPTDANTMTANMGVGRLDSWAFVDPVAGAYPAVPLLALAADFFTVNSPLEDDVDNDGDTQGDGWDNNKDGVIDAADNLVQFPAAWNRETITYGKLNVNTATLASLAALPNLATDPAARLNLAAQLLAYRDRLGPITLPDSPGTPLANWDFSAGRDGLLVSARNAPGFASAGELAVALRTAGLQRNWPLPAPTLNLYAPTGWAYALGELDPNGDASDDGFDAVSNPPQGDLAKYDLRYAYAGNLVTVNSDVYCAYIRVQAGDDAHPRVKRHYIAVIDRSNCVTTGDRPVVRMFTEIK